MVNDDSKENIKAAQTMCPKKNNYHVSILEM
jgi:hypothetical protein